MPAEDNTNKDDSALKVNEGTAQPGQVNPSALERLRHSRRRMLSAAEFVKEILAGNRVVLSKAITLIESTNPDHHSLAQEVIEGCLPHSGKSVRIGITGVPGVGKSTFIEALGKHVTTAGHKLAVLAVDPSSSRTKGSILGDKTRMESLATDDNAFIRPSPSAGSLGGVARKTNESIILCEAAGFDVIFVETVGVGQSETAVHSMVDFFLLLMLSGAGDELQGIKRGIMEMADAIFINKADGDNRHRANQAKAEYKNALHLFPPPGSGWTPVVGTCSALSHEGIPDVWQVMKKYESFTKSNGFFNRKRLEQKKMIMLSTIEELLKNEFFSNEKIKQLLPVMEENMLADKISSYVAAQKLISTYLKKRDAQS
jgi:LAO/AO transport system kinase